MHECLYICGDRSGRTLKMHYYTGNPDIDRYVALQLLLESCAALVEQALGSVRP